MAHIKTLPPQAFDGQIFIDAFRVKWEFDGSARCWKRIGQCPDIPVATEFQTGLLSARLKQLLDGIPAGGGHFGIIAQPLLSLVPQNPNVLFKGTISKTTATKSGTKIDRKSERPFTPEQFVGKILIFKTGILRKKAFLIFTNDADAIFIEGDATAAVEGDIYEIIESTDLNPSGILLGDIMLVSESIDITCVDGDGLPLAGGANCNVDIIYCDNVDNPPGLNFEINKEFLDNLCVIIPGCKGPLGDRGDKGDTGLDGTGDGPQGEQGDPGTDAPEVANTFTGFKIIDVDDIFDTAVVSMELDPENGQLNIVRAKVRTPDTDSPATQLVSTPINRSIVFKDILSFDYELMKPNADPIGVVDVDVLKYPHQFVKPGPGDILSRTTVVNKIKLSDIINAVIAHYEEKLKKINDQYNQELKAYIETKDEASRHILAELAQKVAECEFELPIDFCLGISPCDCHGRSNSSNTASDPFEFQLAEQILALPTGDVSITAQSLGVYAVAACPVPVAGGSEPVDEIIVDLESGPTLEPEVPFEAVAVDSTFISVKFPSNTLTSNTSSLPSGCYVVKINPEDSAIRSDGLDEWIIFSNVAGIGLEAVVTSGGVTTIVSGSVPSILFNPIEKTSVEKAYAEADYAEQVLVIELTEPGRISLCAFVPGTRPQGQVNVEVLRLDLPDGVSCL